MLDVNSNSNETWPKSIAWLNSNPKIDTKWLGSGNTSDEVIKILKNNL